MEKRQFLKNAASLMWFTPLLDSKSLISPIEDSFFDINDESIWQSIRKDYKLNAFINLENGYYSITPQPILKKYFSHIDRVNTLGAYYMRTEQFDNKERVRQQLAALVGCEKEELAITRNTTEGLDLVIGGLNWQQGDEAIMANQDYGAMLNMFKQVENRSGIERKLIDLPLNPNDDEEIVGLYENAITPRTKLIMVCHMVNITGQILPIRKICDMAHKYNVKVMVDGAHAIAHLDFKIRDLNCDFYGASLHKWLSNPLGCGLLYVKKENISSIWPLLASGESDKTKIQHLNHLGTHPVYTELTIIDAIEYYHKIGIENKENRLRLLQNYWVDAVKSNPNIMINTPSAKSRSCAIANVGIRGMKPATLASKLYEKYKIYTVAIDGAGVQGCRVTPNVYTTIKELDKFIEALHDLAK